jgi:2-keto-3-deoxy-L-rhamnonate aldolase RhmA
MQQESFVAALKGSATLLGTLVSLRSPEVAEALALSGFDWLFVDMEHSPIDAAAAHAILQAVAGRALVALRLPSNSPEHFKQALDAGCDAVIVPMVNTVEETRAAVGAAKYPPLGARGAGIGRAHGYGIDFAGYVARANSSVAVIVQIEHIQAVENIEEILAVEGLDAVFLGPYDLSGSMGRLGQVAHPEVVAAMDTVRAACARAGMPWGIFCATAEKAAEEVARGARFVVAGSDLSLMMGAAANSLRTLGRSARR